MKELRLGGVLTALVTPFREDGGLDEAAYRSLVERQIAGGVSGLVPCGTTGESATMTEQERARVISLTVEVAAGRVPVIAGTGSNDTARTVRETRRAQEAGADAALVVTPYYNKPTPTGLEKHYRTVADEGSLPVVVYNVPGRTGTNITPDVLARLWDHPRIIALKEAAANLEQAQTILRDRPSRFAVLSGDDSWTLALMALGAEGVVSVASNEIPEIMARLCEAALSGDWQRARSIHFRALELMRANFLESNPIPVKAALALMDLHPPVREIYRLPLCPARRETRQRVAELLAGLGVPLRALEEAR
ncbi:MAG: 4-hydroxy-tetrahydrodipicolinate synthase [Acidobacteria bacterium]|nr:MAG: 4-hydroxy-tetrahydrodipicolinate synthase [Acidobacteriota bacterium]